ncbi:hypothetical protein ACLB2K_007318 [Fragaria x ananassa]
MAAAKVLGGSATMASMTTRLISKLSLHQEDRPVDLGNLKSLRKGFVAQRLYLVQQRGDRFLFTFNNQRDLGRVKKEGPWSYQRPMVLLNDYDGFSDIMVVPLDFFWIWVEVCDLPVTLTTETTLWLVGDTIRPILNVDQVRLRRGSTRVRVTLPLNSPMRMDRRLRVSLEDVIWVQYKYESLVGLCRDCMMLNHGGLPCPNAQEAEEGTGVPIGAAPATNIASPFEF